MHKALSRTLWGVVFVGGLTVLGAGAANAADTSGEDGVASGNQIGILGEAPVTIGGNAISVLGDSESSGTTTESTASGDSTQAPTATTTGDDGIASGNQVMPDATTPVTVTGNSISVVGDSNAEGTQTSAATTEDDTTEGTATTTGGDGIASGNQVAPEIDAPVVVSGNDVSVIRGDTVLENGLLDDGISEGGILEDGILEDGILEDGILEDGLLNDGLLEDEFTENGILEDGILDDGQLEIGLLDDTIIRDGTNRTGVFRTMLSASPAVSASLEGESTADSESEPAFASPMFRSFGMSAFAPTSADAVVASDGETGEAEPSLTPLMATAALSPAMVLAATGVEALPLIGGIVLMLGSGFVLVAGGRMAHTVG